MACTITRGIGRSFCRKMGGIKEVYLILQNDANYEPTITSDEIIDIMKSGGAAVNLFKVDNLQGLGMFNESPQASVENGTLLFQQNLEVNFRGLDKDRVKVVEEISRASVAAIVHYESGISRLAGMEYFLDVTGGDDSSGSEGGDGNKTALIFSGTEVSKAPLINGASASSPLGSIPVTSYTIIV